MKSSMKLNNGPPSTNKPKRRRPQERPEELAASALRLFTERGYYSTTIDDVAKAAGVTKGAVYHHFDSKEELLITAVRNFFTAAISHMEDLLRGAPDLSQWSGSAEFCQPVQGFGVGRNSQQYLRLSLERLARALTDLGSCFLMKARGVHGLC